MFSSFFGFPELIIRGSEAERLKCIIMLTLPGLKLYAQQSHIVILGSLTSEECQVRPEDFRQFVYGAGALLFEQFDQSFSSERLSHLRESLGDSVSQHNYPVAGPNSLGGLFPFADAMYS
jgi:hypothetical protein